MLLATAACSDRSLEEREDVSTTADMTALDEGGNAGGSVYGTVYEGDEMTVADYPGDCSINYASFGAPYVLTSCLDGAEDECEELCGSKDICGSLSSACIELPDWDRRAACHAAVVHGRALFAEGVDPAALAERLAEHAGALELVALIPVDNVEDADELSIVVGVPAAVASLDDDTLGDEHSVSVEVAAEAVRRAQAAQISDALWGALADLGLEDEAGKSGLWLAVGGWASARLQSGSDGLTAYSENEPPEVAISFDIADGTTLVAGSA
ncbi:hypothetical protein PPSIR1_42326 [Plesiocystis pacifica SIR-1]|uniref:Uncharacterized protein n=2 Tax=Plesiocystis pacifica TaxID=191768 RepID=A6GD21_9BACT|nr:hypothetical protein PPSIR1_42326 [Plesiocystis pacifica SIR-1]